MDLCFCETFEFTLLVPDWHRCRIARSQEEVLRATMARAGIELLDYGCFTVKPVAGSSDTVLVTAYSKAWRERTERASAARLSSM